MAGISGDDDVPFADVRRVDSATVQIAEQLKGLIRQGRLAPGERLPAEPELAAAFGVSRNTLREALRMLSSQNLLVTKRGVRGGTFVSEPRFDLIDELLETSLGLMASADMVAVDQLMQARTLVEVPAAGMVARSHTDAVLADIGATLEREAQGITSGEVFAHRSFHRALLDGTGNPMLRMMSSPISKVLENRMERDRVSPEHWSAVLEEHREIFEAIRAGDAELAERLMAAHLHALGELYVRIDRTATPPAQPAGPVTFEPTT